ncbi:hypothetical protein ACFWYW_44565 [Nonomuraea sp. NPDC059023]|uniref:hypothetical protein n=1 Tax=unclassified Nonomuraea TaxID=2593643 RepID=UPI0036B843F5
MRYAKLTPAVAAAVALLFTPAPAAAAQPATASTSTDQKIKRKSITCIRPSGKKTNYSWKDGTTSTTVYFNNHCSHRVYATVHLKGPLSTDTKCLATNGGTDGKKKFRKGTSQRLTKITKGCY